MKIKTQILVLALLVIGTSGSKCDTPAGHGEGFSPAITVFATSDSLPSLQPEKKRTECVTTKETPFACIERACRFVNGSYDSVYHTCECQDPAELFTPHLGGLCLPLEAPITKVSIDDFNFPTPGTWQMNPMLNFLAKLPDSFRWTHGLMASGIQLNRGEGSLALSVNEFELIQSISKTHVKLPIVPGDFSITYIIPDRANAGSLIDNLNLNEVMLGYSGYLGDLGGRYFEPNPQRWGNLLQRKKHPTQTQVVFPKNRIAFSDLLAAIDIAWARYESNQLSLNPKIQFFTQDGCAGHCLIEHQEQLGNVMLRFAKQYVGGLVIRNQIVVEQTDVPLYSSRSIVLEIDPSESPNLIYLIETGIDNATTNLAQAIEIYSNLGELLFSSKANSIVSHFPKQLRLRDEHFANENSNANSSVIVCEAGLLPSLVLSEPGKRVRVGPDAEQSFWGWLKDLDPAHRFAESLSGLRHITENNRPYVDTGISLHRHAMSVSELATQNSDLSTIFISVDHCFASYGKWKENVRKHARIVNISAALSYDQHACELDSKFKESIGDQEQPFLWILAAGNEGRKNLNLNNALLCPHSRDSANTLVVAAAEVGTDKLAGYSNRGRFFADIAADGAGFYSGEVGTSFATPKVSRAAALLAEEFPMLSIEQLRAAIILGARIPIVEQSKTRLVIRFLETRSGGILDKAASRRIAAHIVNECLTGPVTMDVAEKILKQLECQGDQKSQACQIAKHKLDWMKNTKPFG